MPVNKTIMKKQKSAGRKRTLPQPQKKLLIDHLLEIAQQTVFLLDCSASAANMDILPDRLGAEKECSLEFLIERLKQSSRDQIAVVSYETCARIVCKLQSIRNFQTIRSSIYGIMIGGATAMGEGLKAAERALASAPSQSSVSSILNWFNATPTPPQEQFLKRVILLTDGLHCHGREPLPVALKLKNAGVQIDCIGIGGCKSAVDEDLLKKIASIDPTTGEPRYRFIKDKQTLNKHFQQLATGLTR
ncbi:MAG: hypothetical protein COA78_07775 [Blastopirellula sp.]|nr:MAG: hypothetical protein COA78_07775 [Blastopirellula sp.]